VDNYAIERGSDGERIADNLSQSEARNFLAIFLRKLRAEGATIKRETCQDGFTDYHYVLLRDDGFFGDSVAFFNKQPN